MPMQDGHKQTLLLYHNEDCNPLLERAQTVLVQNPCKGQGVMQGAH